MSARPSDRRLAERVDRLSVPPVSVAHMFATFRFYGAQQPVTAPVDEMVGWCTAACTLGAGSA
eukprot:358752-Chlamydomonas_euryale.AAC.19